MVILHLLLNLLCWLCLCAASPTPGSHTVSSDMWLLFQNDLDWHTTAKHDSWILLSSSHTHTESMTACAKLHEALAPTNGTFFHSDIIDILKYVAFETGMSRSQRYWVSGSSSAQNALCSTISISGFSSAKCTEKLPTLCANSAPHRISNQTDLSPAWQVQVESGRLVFTGTRDHLSFRFLGIPYANKPARWAYSSLYSGPSNISALHFGSPCAQATLRGSEDCLFLNVFTPFLPMRHASDASSSSSRMRLKPVMFWMHGGGFTGGEGSESTFDGGNLASRGDVVVVTINYRLGALGFLALKDGVTKGNYGIADQITALKWVRQHIASFGGDPSRVTIFGQSAGAAAVRALLGSPPAFGLFAGAISQSSPAGFSGSRPYAEYYTIEEEVEVAAKKFIEEVGCGEDVDELACLRKLPWQRVQTALNAPRYIVVDGTFIIRDRLSVDGKGPISSDVHVIFGWMAGDGADFAGAFPLPDTTQAESIQSIGNDTLDLFNVTVRVANDAAAYSAAQHNIFQSMWTYQFERSYMGYEPIPGICDPPFTPAHPFGDPSLPYFQCHSGEQYFTFGTLGQGHHPFRDEFDLPFEQVTVDIWTAFARTYDPNPDEEFLAARGYTVQKWKPWLDAKSEHPVRVLAWPSRGSGWVEREQCKVLGFPLDYYEQ
ncbi:cholinesterase [Favolaschia claudopus]|uniref:Carboxylic ester hydrolase n=1 Tax=Favolaschia claudopus TaxID=2862362 RepID=A0AAW0CBD7_9AGAR